jgi:hypothetical protein
MAHEMCLLADHESVGVSTAAIQPKSHLHFENGKTQQLKSNGQYEWLVWKRKYQIPNSKSNELPLDVGIQSLKAR